MIRVLEAEESPAFREWWQRIEQRRARADERRDGIYHEPTKRKCPEGWEDGVPWEFYSDFSALSRRDQRAIRLLFCRGMTQGQVAKRLGICQQTVGRIRQRFQNKIKQNAPKMFFF